jgi:hypothetical protein
VRAAARIRVASDLIRGPAREPDRAVPRTAAPLIGGWTLYRDPRGAFTVQVPRGWTADVAVGEWGSPGPPTPDYDTALGQPPRGQVTISFGIDYHALVGTIGHVSGCTSAPPVSAESMAVTVAGLPAAYLVVGRHEEWYLTTATDWFLLTWNWPGYAGDWPGILAQPSFPDPATWHADQVLAHLILSTFRPAGPTPPSCT